jgi:hypothetical protein
MKSSLIISKQYEIRERIIDMFLRNLDLDNIQEICDSSKIKDPFIEYIKIIREDFRDASLSNTKQYYNIKKSWRNLSHGEREKYYDICDKEYDAVHYSEEEEDSTDEEMPELVKAPTTI